MSRRPARSKSGSASSAEPAPSRQRPPRLILASASPRRRAILTALGVDFEAVTPRVEELERGDDPRGVVLENARRKARAGLELAAAADGDVVLGVDTEVVLDGAVLGKAHTAAEARSRLEALSGRTHTVVSAIVVASPGLAERDGVASTEVTFARLDPPTLSDYLASGEWRDRAGAYAIQGLGAMLVERVEGDFSNVVGLPLRLLFALLPELREIANRKV